MKKADRMESTTAEYWVEPKAVDSESRSVARKVVSWDVQRE